MNPILCSPKSGPMFLGIGAPSCGTTWLHRMLQWHPEIWLPPIKEVHYFDSLDPHLHSRYRINALRDRARKHFMKRVTHNVGALLSPLSASLRERARVDLTWDRTYFSPGGSMEWYNRLFDAQSHQWRITGEITPDYIALSDVLISQIREKTQARKFLVMLRDPIDALWSGYGRRVRDGLSTFHDSNDLESISNELLGASLSFRLYATNLKRWLCHFDRECFFIGYMDELHENPADLLDRICVFLDVEPYSERLGERLFEKTNTSGKRIGKIPAPIEKRLAARLEPDLRELADMLGGRAMSWHKRALKAL